MLKILLATGQETLNNVIVNKVIPVVDGELVGKVDCKSDLLPYCQTLKPNVVIVTKVLSGTDKLMLETLLELHKMIPSIRIIYLAGQVDTNDKIKMTELGTLVINGIYDIHHEKTITKTILIDLIQNPKKRDDVSYLLKYMKTNQIMEDEIVEFEEEVEDAGDVEKNGYKNVILVSSIKPGTGKSFLSSNLATDIARFGKKKKDGKKPSVALIEADLQNLSLGTLLGFEDDDKYNVKTVMSEIAKAFTKDGHLIDDEGEIKRINAFILRSFKPFIQVQNLSALVGSQLRWEEMDAIKPEYYAYLINVVKDAFDVIIIDTNSSLGHVTTLPLLHMCSKAYYVINLDFNNIRNNKRYQKTIQDMGFMDKVSYVLNEDIDKEYRKLIGQELLEDIQYDGDAIKDSGFNLVARIPEIPKEIFLNRLYESTPIILDDTDYTLKARIEISNVAKEIWEIDNYDWLTKEYSRYKSKIDGVVAKRRSLFGR
jgi:cellulose biosynthesis protein BcsQ